MLAAYAFTFLRFPLRRVAFALFMATLMLPIEVTLIANVETVRDLGWFNSLQGLTAPFLAAAFGTFLIRQGFLGIPSDLRDAAELDGYGHLGFLWNVAVPVTRPIVASFTVISFLSAWNQYLWPRAIVTREAWDTIQIALPKFAGENINELNLGFAAAIIAALPDSRHPGASSSATSSAASRPEPSRDNDHHAHPLHPIHRDYWPSLMAGALVAAACGGDSGEEGSGGDGGDASSVCPVDALADAEGPVEITLWHTYVGLTSQHPQHLDRRVQRSAGQGEGQHREPGHRLRGAAPQVPPGHSQR